MAKSAVPRSDGRSAVKGVIWVSSFLGSGFASNKYLTHTV